MGENSHYREMLAAGYNVVKGRSWEICKTKFRSSEGSDTYKD